MTMHEYSLMERIVEAVEARLETDVIEAESLRIHVRVGALELHSAEAFLQAFEMQAAGTRLEGARMDLHIVPGHIHCGGCDYEGPVREDEADPHDPCPAVACPQCGAVCLVEGGRGVDSIDLEWLEAKAGG